MQRFIPMKFGKYTVLATAPCVLHGTGMQCPPVCSYLGPQLCISHRLQPVLLRHLLCIKVMSRRALHALRSNEGPCAAHTLRTPKGSSIAIAAMRGGLTVYGGCPSMLHVLCNGECGC
jgi:hypothetical protein